MKLLFLILASIMSVMVTANSNLTLEERITRLENINKDLIRQVSLQSYYNQEMLRSEGYSGIGDTRQTETGTKNYYSSAHTTDSYMGMHDHPETDRTIGIGELDVIMNGFHFRTRRNDYELVMPSSKTEDYHATEKIPFPPVPASVLRQRNSDAQITEMQQYFKAFHQRNKRIRDYTKYFLPNLCYMEGAWTTVDTDSKDTLDKVQYEAYTGSHIQSDDNAFLPRSMLRIDGNNNPVIGQWHYRILCHPIKGGLDPSILKPVEDLQHRVPRDLTPKEALENPGQRFAINDKEIDFGNRGRNRLDAIMNQIPGKNNYKGHVEDHSLGGTVLELTRNRQAMNTGFYHRYYRTDGKGAMGTNDAYRGYNDAHTWVAQTSQDKVVTMRAETCAQLGKRKTTWFNCTKDHAAYTFALPLEIVYTTPLARWNPFGVPEQEERQQLPVPDIHVGEGTLEEVKKYYKDYVEDRARTPVDDVTEGGKRNGGTSVATAYHGASSKHFYKTPQAFYKRSDPTGRPPLGVLDYREKVRRLVSSGIRTFTPEIPDVGRVRLRYPLAPLHWEGSIVSKELNALKEMTLKPKSFMFLYEEEPCHTGNVTSVRQTVEYELQTTVQNPPGMHSHRIIISTSELAQLKIFHRPLSVTTSHDQGHAHVLQLAYNSKRGLYYTSCDSIKSCWDGHRKKLKEVKL